MFKTFDENSLKRTISIAYQAMLDTAGDSSLDVRLSKALIAADIIKTELASVDLDVEEFHQQIDPDIDLSWAGRNAAVYGFEDAHGHDPDSDHGKYLLIYLNMYFREAAIQARAELTKKRSVKKL